MKLDLGDGNWAHLRDPKKVPERLRRPIVQALTRALADNGGEQLAGLDPKDLQAPDAAAKVSQYLKPEFLTVMADVNDLLVIALVDEWSFDVPVSLDSVLDLPGDEYDALQTGVAPLLKDVLPSFDGDADPKALTSN